MTKKEILELISQLNENDDVDSIVSPKFLNLDTLKADLNSNNDIKSWFDSERDVHSQKAINTALENFKNKDMQKLIEAEILKRNPQKTPEQIKLEELEKKFEASERAKSYAEMKAKFKDILNEKKIPGKLVDFLLADNEDSTNANITLFEDSMKSYVDDKVSERISSAKDPQPGNPQPSETSLGERLAKQATESNVKNYDYFGGAK